MIGNLGAVIRNCEHCGIDLLVLGSKGSCSIQLASVAKSSAGAVEHMPIALSDDLIHDLYQIKDQGVECIGLDMNTSQELMKLPRPTGHRALVVGSEVLDFLETFSLLYIHWLRFQRQVE